MLTKLKVKETATFDFSNIDQIEFFFTSSKLANLKQENREKNN